MGVDEGERVVISAQDITPAEFAHPLLLTPKLRELTEADVTLWRDNLCEKRIASPKMFLNAEPLPHVICSRTVEERGGNGEAIEHGNA